MYLEMNARSAGTPSVLVSPDVHFAQNTSTKNN